MPRRAANGTQNELRARRLVVQQIARPTLVAPRDVVGWFGAMQAQDYAGAKWALGLRLADKGVTEAAIERALAAGDVLRMHVMRWTWQLVLPEDVRWMLALVMPRLVARAAGRHRQLELDAATFRKSNAVLEKALRDGRHRTREELADLLGKAGISTAKQRLSHLLGRAELDAILCSGARRGKQFTYVHLDERAPKQKTLLARDEALAELARRYFQSRGPATLADFMWWTGLAATDARAGLEAIRSSLASDVIDGQTYFRAEEPPRVARPPAGVRRAAAPLHAQHACYLLPAFDEYLVAYRKRDACIDPVHAKGVNAGGGMLHPAVVCDGRVTGSWRRVLTPRTVNIEVDLFEPPARGHEDAIVRAAARFGRFLGLETEMAKLSVRGTGPTRGRSKVAKKREGVPRASR